MVLAQYCWTTTSREDWNLAMYRKTMITCSTLRLNDWDWTQYIQNHSNPNNSPLEHDPSIILCMKDWKLTYFALKPSKQIHNLTWIPYPWQTAQKATCKANPALQKTSVLIMQTHRVIAKKCPPDKRNIGKCVMFCCRFDILSLFCEWHHSRFATILADRTSPLRVETEFKE